MHQRLKSWPDLWFAVDDHPLKHVLLKNMPNPHHQTLTLDPHSRRPRSRSQSRSQSRSNSRSRSPSPFRPSRDPTAALSDETLLLILSHLPSPALSSAALASKRWLRLSSLLRRSLRLLRWPSLPSIPGLFPNLTHLDLVPASFSPPSLQSPSPLPLLSRGPLSLPLNPQSGPTPQFLPPNSLSTGLEALSAGLPNLGKISFVATDDSQSGLLALAAGCPTLQAMDIHRCTDLSLRPISAFENLQILRLIGSVDGLYSGPGVTDIGLTILAHGCKRLVKLELSGCEGSYDGISAIGRCCLMLEELTFCDHRMDAGWMAGLSFCGNLKTLRMQSCRVIDADPGPEEHLGVCPTVERVQLHRCQVRDRRSLRALFMMCESARELMFQNCWGMDNEVFGIASICRRVKFLSLEGCSQLTTEGLESVVLSWNDLQRLTVVSCNNVKDDAVSPAMSNLFAVLKEFKWRPDSKSVLATSLAGTGMGKKGGRFFKRV